MSHTSKTKSGPHHYNNFLVAFLGNCEEQLPQKPVGQLSAN